MKSKLFSTPSSLVWIAGLLLLAASPLFAQSNTNR
jgi:hypothetical protein